MMLSLNPLNDYFHHYWPTVVNENQASSALFFSEKDMNMEDSRDTDFKKPENRLAYMNKFAHVNVGLVEICTSKFFEQYFQGDKNYFSEKLQICSLSNGPGIDIVGFIRALYKSNHPKCIPVLQAINVHSSWQNVYETLMSSVYHAYNLKFNVSNMVYAHENIQFMDCDIFNNLSPEAQNSISSCDVLLMLKTFASSKATLDTFLKALQKIFSLLKPEGLVFFFGNKRNVKELTEKDNIKKYVKCIYGPEEIELQKLSAYEIISKVANVKSNLYHKLKFLVLQKKTILEETNVDSSLILKSKKKKNRRKKKKNVGIPANPNNFSVKETSLNGSEEEDCIDSNSSSSSSSKQFDTLSVQSHQLLYKSTFQPMVSQRENSRNYADDEKQSITSTNIASLTENMLPCQKTNVEPPGSITEKENVTELFSLKGLTSEGIDENSGSTDSKQSSQLEEPIKDQSVVMSEHVNNTDNIDRGKPSLNLPTGSISVFADTFPPKKINSETVSSVTKENISKRKLTPLFPDSTKINSEIVNSVTREGIPIREYITEQLALNKLPECNRFIPHPDITRRNVSADHKQSAELFQSLKMTTLEEQGMQDAVSKRHILTEISREDKSSSRINNKGEKGIKTCSNQSKLAVCDKSLTKNISPAQLLCPTDKDDIHSMLQRCENLVTSLERAVAVLSTDMQSLQNTKQCCSRHVCSRNPYHCVHCNNRAGYSCHGKMCHCIKTECKFDVSHSNGICCKEHVNAINHNERSLKPYLTIPVQHNDLGQILSFIS